MVAFVLLGDRVAISICLESAQFRGQIDLGPHHRNHSNRYRREQCLGAGSSLEIRVVLPLPETGARQFGLRVCHLPDREVCLPRMQQRQLRRIGQARIFDLPSDCTQAVVVTALEQAFLMIESALARLPLHPAECYSLGISCAMTSLPQRMSP